MKKNIILSSFVGTSIVGAVTPLTILSANANQVFSTLGVHQDAEDIRYGINEQTYLSLKQDFEEKLKVQMKKEQIKEGSEVWNQKIASLQQSLAIFDDQSQKCNASYGQLTTALINYARSEHGISLRRVTKASWDNVIDLFNGTTDSVSLYMDHCHYSHEQKTHILALANQKFAEIEENLIKQGYKDYDPYGALSEARRQILFCFDELNTTIAKTAANMQIANFLSKYSIETKHHESKALYSNLVSKWNVGEVMSEFNDVFTMIDNDTGLPKELNMEPSGMIPNYVIRPKFGGFEVDKYTNSYSIKIDWTAVNNYYFSTNDEADAEGHLYDFKSSYQSDLWKKTLTKEWTDEDKADPYKVLGSMPVRLMTYPIFETAAGQNASILEAYFGEKGIRFQFPKSSDKRTKLEPFYNQYIDNFTFKVPEDLQQKLEGKTEIEITKQGLALTQDLADAGLQISEEVDGQRTWLYLSDVIKSAKTKEPKDYTLAEKFVANCNVFSITHIEPNTFKSDDVQSNEISTVTNDFYVAYADPDVEGIDWTDKQKAIEFIYRSILGETGEEYKWVNLDSTIQPGMCLNYVTSEQYFFNLCKKYTTIRKMVDTYANLPQAIDKTESQLKVLSITNEISYAISIAELASFSLLFMLDICCQSEKVEFKFTEKDEEQSMMEYKDDFINVNFHLTQGIRHFLRFCKTNLIIMDLVGIATSTGGIVIQKIIKSYIQDKFVTPLDNIKQLTQKYMEKPGFKEAFDNLVQRVKNDETVLSQIDTDPKKGPSIVNVDDYRKKLEIYIRAPFARYKEMNSIYSNWDWKYAPISEQIHTEIKNYVSEATIAVNNYYKTTFGKTFVSATESMDLNCGNVQKLKLLMIGGVLVSALSTTLLIMSIITHTKVKGQAHWYDTREIELTATDLQLNVVCYKKWRKVREGDRDGNINLFHRTFAAYYWAIFATGIASVVGFGAAVAEMIALFTYGKMPVYSIFTNSNLPDTVPMDDEECSELLNELNK